MKYITKFLVVIVILMLGLPIVLAEDPPVVTGGLDWLNKQVWGVGSWVYDFITTGNLDTKYLKFQAYTVLFCNTQPPVNSADSVDASMLESYTRACNVLRMYNWDNIPDVYWNAMSDYIDNGKPLTVSALTGGDIEVPKEYVVEYNKKVASLNNDMASAKKNTTLVWLYLNFVVGLVFSVLTLMYYMVEIMFIAYLFLELIPKLLIKFRDILVNYFIGRL